MSEYFEIHFPSLKKREVIINLSIETGNGLRFSNESVFGKEVFDKETIISACLDKEVVREAIEAHFVCGYDQGLSGAVHSRYCRKCALKKYLGFIEKEEED